MKNNIWKVVGFSLLFAGSGQWAVADEGDKRKSQVEPIELLINFKIAGASPDGAVYTIGGPGYAPDDIFKNGEISDEIEEKRLVTNLEGAQITFSGNPNTDPVVRFSCLPGSCNMTFKDGSVLTSDAGVALEGRAIPMWGPVFKSPDFDPAGVFPIRILGCGGLKGSGPNGRYAGMVGSICFNGQLNFNGANPLQLTGSSKCTITLHTPMDASTIP